MLVASKAAKCHPTLSKRAKLLHPRARQHKQWLHLQKRAMPSYIANLACAVHIAYQLLRVGNESGMVLSALASLGLRSGLYAARQ